MDMDLYSVMIIKNIKLRYLKRENVQEFMDYLKTQLELKDQKTNKNNSNLYLSLHTKNNNNNNFKKKLCNKI